jgi:hypothetical protein
LVQTRQESDPSRTHTYSTKTNRYLWSASRTRPRIVNGNCGQCFPLDTTILYTVTRCHGFVTTLLWRTSTTMGNRPMHRTIGQTTKPSTILKQREKTDWCEIAAQRKRLRFDLTVNGR